MIVQGLIDDSAGGSLMIVQGLIDDSECRGSLMIVSAGAH